MRVIVGLGNPGVRYERTRHNAGFLIVEALAAKEDWAEQHDALTARVPLTVGAADEQVLLVKPLTWMNRSGEAVLALSKAEGFGPDDILVVFDDFLLDFGRLRLRRTGSDGGHNGLASVLGAFESDAVARLRVGVGPVPAQAEDIDFVLAPFALDDDVDGLVQRSTAAVECWLQDGIEVAMNRFNGCPALTRPQAPEQNFSD